MSTDSTPQIAAGSLRNSVSGLASQGSGRSVSVALGGGGGRGLSHLGVLQAIEEHGLKVERVCGVSIGAIAGAMFAIEPNASKVREKVLAFVNSSEFRKRQSQMLRTSAAGGGGASVWMHRFRRLLTAHRSINRALRHASVLPETILQHVVDSLLPDIRIEEMSVPFQVVAVDLISGQRIAIDRGSLRDAVRASASIPGIFPPVAWEERLLSDIGVVDSVPVRFAKEQASGLTLAVDVSEAIAPMNRCKNIVEVFSRIQQVAELELRQHSLAEADIIVRPQIGRRAWFDFTEPESLFEQGWIAANTQLASLASR